MTKEEIEKFCLTYYPDKKFQIGSSRKEQWFYIQAGYCFQDYIHYEYRSGSGMEFHIEFNNENDSVCFYRELPPCIINILEPIISTQKNYRWYKIKNFPSNAKLLLAFNSESFDSETFKLAFEEIHEYMEKDIKKLEASKFNKSIKRLRKKYQYL